MEEKVLRNLNFRIKNNLNLIHFFAFRFDEIIEKDINRQKNLLEDIKETKSSVGNIESGLSLDESDISIAESNFMNIGSSSPFLMAHSYFDDSLVKFCDEVAEINKIELKWSDLRGSTIEAIKKYIVSILGINFEFSKSKE